MSRAIDFILREGHMSWARLNSESVLSDIRRRGALSKLSYIAGIVASGFVISTALTASNAIVPKNESPSSAESLAKFQFGPNRFENSAGGVSTSQEVIDGLTNTADVRAYIDDQVKALNAGKGVDCDVVSSVKANGWKDSQGAYSMPACVKFKGGNHIKEHTLIFSYLKSGESYFRLTKFAGVFHKADGAWTFTNLKLSTTNSFEVEGYKTIPIVDIQDTLINDFPDLYPQEEIDRVLKSMKEGE